LWSYLGNSDQTKAKHCEAEKDPACSFSHDEVFFNPIVFGKTKLWVKSS